MKYYNTELFFKCFSFQYDLDTNQRFDSLLADRNNFNKSDFKDELVKLLQSKNQDIVDLALEEKFVYLSEDRLNYKCANELKLCADSIFYEIKRNGGIISTNQIALIKDTFDDLEDSGILSLDIFDLFKQKSLIETSFELKLEFFKKFTPSEFTIEDIVFKIKTISWEYLFKNTFDASYSNKLSVVAHDILSNYTMNDGWLDMSELTVILRKEYPIIELYDLSKMNWNSNVKHLRHYRNNDSLGYKRITR